MRYLTLTAVIMYVAALTWGGSAPADQTVRGIVLDESGARLSGAQVVLLRGSRDEAGVEIGRATAASDGTFEIACAEPELSSIRTAIYLTAGLNDRLGFEGVNNPKATQRVTCPLRAIVSGTVRDPDGSPVEGAVVEPVFFVRGVFFGQQYLDYRKVESAAGIRPAVTDAQGRFTISGLPSGWSVCLKARRQGFGDGLTGAATATKDIEPERAVPAGAEGVIITLKGEGSKAPAGRIKGRLLDESTREPMPGVKVTAVETGPGSSSTSSTVTRSDGSFEFDEVPPGAYVACVLEADKPVRPQTGVEVRENEVTELVLYGIEGTLVSGRVVDKETGAALPGILVASPGSRPVVTDGDGGFSIRMLPGPGILSVIGRARGYRQLDHELEVPEAGEVGGLELRLEPATRIYGRVKDPSGEAVDGALIRIVTQNGPSDTVQADSEGGYEFTLDQASSEQPEVYLIASDPPANSGAVRQIHLAPGKSAQADVSLRPAASVSGVVNGSDGRPVAAARVLPMIEAGRNRIYSLHNETRSDASGKFTVRGLISGAGYFVRIEAEGYGPLELGKDRLPMLSTGETASVEFVLPRQTSPALPQ